MAGTAQEARLSDEQKQRAPSFYFFILASSPAVLPDSDKLRIYLFLRQIWNKYLTTKLHSCLILPYNLGNHPWYKNYTNSKHVSRKAIITWQASCVPGHIYSVNLPDTAHPLTGTGRPPGLLQPTDILPFVDRKFMSLANHKKTE